MRTAHHWLAAGALLTVLALTGCGLDQQATGPNSKSEATLPGDTTTKGEAAPAFHALTLDQAQEKAKADGKVVMIDFYADWCGPCKLLDKKTWPDAKVQGWLRDHAVALKIDIDKDEAVAEKFKITSIPTLVFLKPDGTVVGKMVGFVKPEEFVERADAILSGNGN
ncbi:MAG: thioredoxin family protein [Planctomycetia bacterium]|nr:thioredoxin family protein [Planctomycetia bacterium]